MVALTALVMLFAQPGPDPVLAMRAKHHAAIRKANQPSLKPLFVSAPIELLLADEKCRGLLGLAEPERQAVVEELSARRRFIERAVALAGAVAVSETERTLKIAALVEDGSARIAGHRQRLEIAAGDRRERIAEVQRRCQWIGAAFQEPLKSQLKVDARQESLFASAAWQFRNASGIAAINNRRHLE